MLTQHLCISIIWWQDYNHSLIKGLNLWTLGRQKSWFLWVGMGQNLVPLLNIKIAGKWIVFITMYIWSKPGRLCNNDMKLPQHNQFGLRVWPFNPMTSGYKWNICQPRHTTCLRAMAHNLFPRMRCKWQGCQVAQYSATWPYSKQITKEMLGMTLPTNHHHKYYQNIAKHGDIVERFLSYTQMEKTTVSQQQSLEEFHGDSIKGSMAQRGGTSVQCMWWLYTMIMALYRWHPSNDISGVCKYIYMYLFILYVTQVRHFTWISLIMDPNSTWQPDSVNLCQFDSEWTGSRFLSIGTLKVLDLPKYPKKNGLLMPQVQNQFEHLKQFPFQEISKCPTIHSLKHPWAWNAQNFSSAAATTSKKSNILRATARSHSSQTHEDANSMHTEDGIWFLVASSRANK